MIVQWMLYTLLIGGVVSAAAWLAERGARAQRWPTRWVWAGALAVSVGAPLAAWLRPTAAIDAGAAGVSGLAGDYVLHVVPLVVGGLEATGPAVAPLLLGSWAVLSALLLGLVTVLAVRLEVRRRGWPGRVVDGVDVLVSERTGPAAVGLIRGRVVVPRWALALEPRKRRLLVLHEAEHVRARDPQLALLGLLLCVAAPWNLALWWQLRRLRLAIEMDCDARVLRRSRTPRAYGDLLLAVGQRRAHLALGLAESPGLLERRIRMIAENGRKRARVRGGVLLAVAGLVLAMACEAPEPVTPGDPELESEPTRTDGATLDGRVIGLAQSCAAVFVDGERVAPEAVDWELADRIDRIEVVKGKALEGADLEDGCGLVWIATGDAPADLDARLRQLLGTAASSVERPRVPLTRSGTTAELSGEATEGPTFTPMTERPQITNGDAVSRALEDNYPPLLREAGIGGGVDVWLYIDETGAVRDVRLHQGSGREALDEAALRVARTMEFTPALNRDERVPVWVSLRINFDAE